MKFTVLKMSAGIKLPAYETERSRVESWSSSCLLKMKTYLAVEQFSKEMDWERGE